MIRSMLAIFAMLLSACSPQESENEPEETSVSEAKSGSGTAKAFVPPIDIDPDAFVEGNLFFIGYHELGHALISELDIPVAGREEDAVDRLAIWMMTPEDNSPPDYLLGAMRGWFMTAADVPLSEIEWWDEHGADQQRAYQIACLLYGADAKAHKSVADIVKLPEERRESCETESTENNRSWRGLLGEDEVIPESEQAKVAIRYAASDDYADDIAYLREVGVLEDIAGIIRNNYRLKKPVTLEARTCDEVNAYWFSDSRTLTICYELVADFRELSKKLKQA